MSRSIHFKIDDETYKEWSAIGVVWHGIRAKLLRRKLREVIDEVKKNPIYLEDKSKQKKAVV